MDLKWGQIHVHISTDAVARAAFVSTFDVVFATQVFEHLPHPWRAASEIARILRPGGFLFFSVPFLELYHTSGGGLDYYRYTHHGIVALFEAAGLCVQEVRSGGSYLTTTGNMLGLAGWDFSMEEHDENQDFRAAHTVMAIIHKPLRKTGAARASARVSS